MGVLSFPDLQSIKDSLLLHIQLKHHLFQDSRLKKLIVLLMHTSFGPYLCQILTYLVSVPSSLQHHCEIMDSIFLLLSEHRVILGQQRVPVGHCWNKILFVVLLVQVCVSHVRRRVYTHILLVVLHPSRCPRAWSSLETLQPCLGPVTNSFWDCSADAWANHRPHVDRGTQLPLCTCLSAVAHLYPWWVFLASLVLWTCSSVPLCHPVGCNPNFPIKSPLRFGCSLGTFS